jgi:hypothetical protein
MSNCLFDDHSNLRSSLRVSLDSNPEIHRDMPEANMSRRGRTDRRRNCAHPELDQLDARLLLSVTAAGGGATCASITGSADDFIAVTGGVASNATLAARLSISLRRRNK